MKAGGKLAWLLGAALLAPGVAQAAAPKRDVPDYDGRGGEPTTAGDVAIWVPRIALAPAYAVSEFVIRRPLGAIITAAERGNVPKVLYDFFAFGPDHKAGFAPVAFLDFGFNPSVGVYLFWDDAIFDGHDLRFHGTTWGSDWLAGVLTERFRFHGKDSLTLNFTGIRRPDLLYFGTGASTLEGDKARYGLDKLEAAALLDVHLWRASRVQAGMGLRSVTFYDGHFQEDPNVDQQVAIGAFALPPGFARGYTAETNHLLVAVDSRLPHPAPGSGVRVEAQGEQGSDVRRTPGASWLRYGATAAAYADLNDHGRVVSLAATTIFADPLSSEPVPFTELASLGGSGPLRGFLPGRLLGRSAAALVAHYRWPVWAFIDGSLQAGVGNVFDEHLQDFKPKLLRFSSAIGIETVGSPDSSLEILFGVGSETFDRGAQVDSIRFVVGTNRGF
jgi:Omp85 superfamily domain